MNVLNDLAVLQSALKADFATVLGTPLLTLLQSEQTAMQQPGFAGVISLQAAWLVFIGQIPLALPNLGMEAAQALNAFLIAKLTEFMEKMKPPVATTGKTGS